MESQRGSPAETARGGARGGRGRGRGRARSNHARHGQQRPHQQRQPGQRPGHGQAQAQAHERDRAAHEKETQAGAAAAAAAAATLCGVCRLAPHKYRCPAAGCEVRQCSLACSKSHKLAHAQDTLAGSSSPSITIAPEPKTTNPALAPLLAHPSFPDLFVRFPALKGALRHVLDSLKPPHEPDCTYGKLPTDDSLRLAFAPVDPASVAAALAGPVPKRSRPQPGEPSFAGYPIPPWAPSTADEFAVAVLEQFLGSADSTLSSAGSSLATGLAELGHLISIVSQPPSTT